MSSSERVPPTVVVDLVFITILINAAVLALSFGVMAGYASFMGYPSADLFGAGAGFLTAVLVVMGLLRSILVSLLQGLVE